MDDGLIPVLVYEDIEMAHDFLVTAFGFEPGGVSRDAAGKVNHGEVHLGGSTIWLHRVTAEHEMDSPLRVEMAGSGIVAYVRDVDAHHEKARAAGAHIDAEPADQPYGQREYAARDPEGHRWWFATQIATLEVDS